MLSKVIEKFSMHVLVLVFSFSIGLVGCGGGGGGGGNTPDDRVPLEGSAVKGPLANALVEVYSVDSSVPSLQGELVVTGSTNSQAAFSGINLDPAGAPYLLVVTADEETIDITTNAVPVITSLRTIVSAASLDGITSIYATPLTSMAVAIVASRDDTSDENIQAQLTLAQNQVKTTLGFGLDETLDIFTTAPLLTDETNMPQEQENTAQYRLAIEALSAVLVDIAEETDSSEDTPTDALAALAEDLSDGALDGQKGSSALAELEGFDVSTLDDIDVSTLTVPGTNISINDIELVLETDKETTGSTQTLDDTVDVTAEPPVLVADVDLDGFSDDIDNCPVNSNANQSDTNGNGVGDLCDAAPVIAGAIDASVDEDGSVDIDLSAGVSDAENDALLFTVGEEALDGSLFLFTPEANENGTESFSYSVSDGTSTTSGSVNVTISPVNDIGLVSISGSTTQGQILTAIVTDDIDGLVNATISYVWSDQSGIIDGETGSSLSLTQGQVGEAITVSASYTDEEGFQETLESDATSIVGDINDQPTGQLALSGTAREDELVSIRTASLSDPDGSIVVVSVQWRGNGVAIDGATSSEFTIPAELVGSTLSVDVSVTDTVFTNDTVSFSVSFSSVVANANDIATGALVISDISPTEGQELQVSADDIQDEDGLINASFSYQWLADGENISGATSSTFTPSQQQVGTLLSVEVNFNDDFGSAESLTSSETSVVTNVNDTPQGVVEITGTPSVGNILTASNNITDGDGLGEITYEWFLNGATTSETGATYTVQSSDEGANISVVASYQDDFGEFESVESESLLAIAEPTEFNIEIVGSWNFHNEEFGTYDKTILSFTETGEFFFFNINSDDDDSCRERGFEYGTFELVDNEVNLTRLIDTNGCVGLFDSTDNESSETLFITEEETQSLTVTNNDPNDLFTITITRILTNTDSIVGPWHEELDEGGDNNEGNDLSNLLLFLGDGRFYTMDADLNNLSENDFGFGDYMADPGGDGLSLTFRFDGTDGETLDETRIFPSVDIVDNELFFNNIDDQFGIGRVSVDSANPSAPLAFTEAELDAGLTWFFPLLEPEDCGNEWVVEEMNFDAIGYSLDACGAATGEEVGEAYEVLESGIVRLVSFEEFIKRMSFDPELQAYLVCYEDTELAASDCSVENQGYAFLSRADAQAFADEQSGNVGFLPLSPGTYASQVSGDDLPTVFVLAEGGAGSWSYGNDEGGGITWSVDSEGLLNIVFIGGGTEELTLISGTVMNGTVTIIFSNEPDANATWLKVDEVTLT